MGYIQKSSGIVAVTPLLDLEIEEGEFVRLSGSGKSASLSRTAGLESASACVSKIKGTDATHRSPGGRGLATSC